MTKQTLQVNPEIFKNYRCVEEADAKKYEMPHTFARLRGMGRNPADRSAMLQRRKTQEEQKSMPLLPRDFVAWPMAAEVSDQGTTEAP